MRWTEQDYSPLESTRVQPDYVGVVFGSLVRYVILTCHSYVTVYIYPRYCHLKSLASYFGLQLFSLSHKQVMGPGL